MHVSSLNVIGECFGYGMMLSAKAYSFCAVSGTYLRLSFKYGRELKGFSHLIKDAGLPN